MKLSDVYECIKKTNTHQLIPVIDYITNNYPDSILDEYNSIKTKIPTWKLDDAYIGIGCRKHYITIYFSNPDAAKTVEDNTRYCRALKSCVNFSYKRELPLDAIYKGIDKCFKMSL